MQRERERERLSLPFYLFYFFFFRFSLSLSLKGAHYSLFVYIGRSKVACCCFIGAKKFQSSRFSGALDTLAITPWRPLVRRRLGGASNSGTQRERQSQTVRERERERGGHCKENKSPFPLVGERVEVEGGKRSIGKTPAISPIFRIPRKRLDWSFRRPARFRDKIKLSLTHFRHNDNQSINLTALHPFYHKCIERSRRMWFEVTVLLVAM